MNSKINTTNNSHFDVLSAIYLETRGKDANFRLYKKMLWEFVFARVRSYFPTSCSVLEAMCGSADGLEILTENRIVFTSYHAFDLSMIMAEAANRKIEKTRALGFHIGVPRAVFVADICTEFTLKKFDMIILLGGLHHVFYRSEEVVKKIYESLSPAGIFVNIEPTHSNYIMEQIRAWIYLKNSFFDEKTEAGFELNKYNLMLRKTGFHIINQCFPGLLLYSALYNPDAFGQLPRIPQPILKMAFLLESSVYYSNMARFLSFATLTICQRPLTTSNK